MSSKEFSIPRLAWYGELPEDIPEVDISGLSSEGFEVAPPCVGDTLSIPRLAIFGIVTEVVCPDTPVAGEE